MISAELSYSAKTSEALMYGSNCLKGKQEEVILLPLCLLSSIHDLLRQCTQQCLVVKQEPEKEPPPSSWVFADSPANPDCWAAQTITSSSFLVHLFIFLSH
jgi:hypothetical protein